MTRAHTSRMRSVTLAALLAAAAGLTSLASCSPSDPGDADAPADAGVLADGAASGPDGGSPLPFDASPPLEAGHCTTGVCPDSGDAWDVVGDVDGGVASSWRRLGFGFSGKPCVSPFVQLSTGSPSGLLWICTEDQGVVRVERFPNTSTRVVLTNVLGANPNGRSLGGGLTSRFGIGYTGVYGAAPMAGLPNLSFLTYPDGTSGSSNVTGENGDPVLITAGMGVTNFASDFRGVYAGAHDPGNADPHAVVFRAGVRIVIGDATGTPRAFNSTGDLVVVQGVTANGQAAVGGVYRSADGGLTWAASNTGIDAADVPKLFALKHVPGRMFVGVRGGGQIYASDDGGATWTKKNAGIPAGVEVLSFSNPIVGAPPLYVATSSGAYRSDDDGETWKLEGFAGVPLRGILAWFGVRVIVATDDAVWLNGSP